MMEDKISLHKLSESVKIHYRVKIKTLNLT